MEQKFNKVFDAYNKDIFRLIYSFTLDVCESKDILQETFLKYYKNINKLTLEEIEIKKWLIKVAANLSKDYLRKIKRQKLIITADDNIYAVHHTFDIEFLEVLKKLDKKYRIPVYLHYYEGYKTKEISTILNIKHSAVKMRLLRAKKILKKEMEIK